MLIIIECFIKYIWCVVLKKKDAATVTDAFEQILNNSKLKPQFLHTDMRKKFVNVQFNKLWEYNSIKLYHIYSEVKSAIIEWFNRTLKDKFRLHFEIYQNHKWLWILPDIIKDNEKHVHRTVGGHPEMISDENEH